MSLRDLTNGDEVVLVTESPNLRGGGGDDRRVRLTSVGPKRLRVDGGDPRMMFSRDTGENYSGYVWPQLQTVADYENERERYRLTQALRGFGIQISPARRLGNDRLRLMLALADPLSDVELHVRENEDARTVVAPGKQSPGRHQEPDAQVGTGGRDNA